MVAIPGANRIILLIVLLLLIIFLIVILLFLLLNELIRNGARARMRPLLRALRSRTPRCPSGVCSCMMRLRCVAGAMIAAASGFELHGWETGFGDWARRHAAEESPDSTGRDGG